MEWKLQLFLSYFYEIEQLDVLIGIDWFNSESFTQVNQWSEVLLYFSDTTHVER